MLGEGLDAAEGALRVLADVTLAGIGPTRRSKLTTRTDAWRLQRDIGTTTVAIRSCGIPPPSLSAMALV